MRRKQARDARDLARQRMYTLFEMAEAEHLKHPDRSDRYVEIARRISTRLRVRMPNQLKRQFCKRCGRYLPPSLRRVRLSDGLVTVTCARCGHTLRYPYRP